MFSAKVRSWAKLNLSLNISGVSGGYHLLDSVVCSVDICDTVCAKARSDALVNVYMHGLGSENIPPEKNNAVRAGEAFVAAFGTRGADIDIYKDIPLGAGLGRLTRTLSGRPSPFFMNTAAFKTPSAEISPSALSANTCAPHSALCSSLHW